MANLQAGGMQSLGEYYGADGASNARIVEAWNHTENYNFFASTTVQKVANISTDGTVNYTRPVDLNVRDVSAVNGKHLLDIIMEHDAQIDVTVVVGKIQKNQYIELSPPFGAKSNVETGCIYVYDTNIYIIVPNLL